MIHYESSKYILKSLIGLAMKGSANAVLQRDVGFPEEVETLDVVITDWKGLRARCTLFESWDPKDTMEEEVV